MQPTTRLEKELGYTFSDPELLHKALTHRSLGNSNNERLEFLGDALLGCVIADELFHNFPHVREGRLSRLRSSLVRRETLAEIGKRLAIGDFLRLGQGERKSGGHRRESILSDALEAIFGAIYLDSDFATCRQCILQLYADKLASLSDTVVLKDAKTRLQEYLQARHLELPDYTVKDVSGKAHARYFEVICTVAGHEPCNGEGASRRHAEQEAASKMLRQLEAD
ncbi:MAG: ribonuclease III [Gammaproteobacteria bacterium]